MIREQAIFIYTLCNLELQGDSYIKSEVDREGENKENDDGRKKMEKRRGCAQK